MNTNPLKRFELPFAAQFTSSDRSSPGPLASYLRPTRLEQKRETVRDERFSAAVIFSPAEGERIPSGRIVIEGFALAGIGKELKAVELSLDCGSTWIKTEISDHVRAGEWRRWRKLLRLAPGQYILMTRTIDTSDYDHPTNAKDLWHRVRIEVI